MKVKLDHVNLTVENLKSSIDWYNKIFGFELVEKGISAAGKSWGIVANNDSMICMTEYKDRSRADHHDQDKVHQIFHFGIRISDLDLWQKIVKAYELRLYYGGVVRYPDSQSWYVHDPDGHEIEVSYSDQKPLVFPELSKGERHTS
ncbi:MAG TPA: hypothetical protein DCL41_05470 [Bdellovibrionales bacterium]|nr:hypothetical protein [Pseudobdellovibrionaceae bacterium]HAG91298.1 hypothetical protein [Bdellovibrionales bacterium]|tara:strand:+ start:2413 stop:2850 length:438 start_codon:yes stop_codon:yes gene_type:complete